MARAFVRFAQRFLAVLLEKNEPGLYTGVRTDMNGGKELGTPRGVTYLLRHYPRNPAICFPLREMYKVRGILACQRDRSSRIPINHAVGRCHGYP